jgi:hypothetical protein
MLLHEPAVSPLLDVWTARMSGARVPDVRATWERAIIDLRHGIELARADTEMRITAAAKALGMCDPARLCMRCEQGVDTPNGVLCADCRSRAVRAGNQKRRRETWRRGAA